MISSIRKYFVRKQPAALEIPAAEAYNLWSETYDRQPGNLILQLDEIIVSSLISLIELKDKHIADIGCGTGRHWHKLYAQAPSALTGFDVSPGMLARLKEKFPAANTQIVSGDTIESKDNSFDFILSTLTIAHIEDVNAAISSWSRSLKPGGYILLTDFHPAILAQGGSRSFRHHSKTWSVKNFIHPVTVIIDCLLQHGIGLVEKEERIINESVRSFYEAQDAIHVYNRYKGLPVIYGLLAQKKECS